MPGPETMRRWQQETEKMPHPGEAPPRDDLFSIVNDIHKTLNIIGITADTLSDKIVGQGPAGNDGGATKNGHPPSLLDLLRDCRTVARAVQASLAETLNSIGG